MKELRESKKLTQQAAADAIGVHKHTLIKWEKGERQLFTFSPYYKSYCDLLGISPAALLPDDWNIGAAEPEPLDLSALSTILEHITTHPTAKKLGHKWVAMQIDAWLDRAKEKPDTWEEELKQALDIRLREEEMRGS